MRTTMWRMLGISVHLCGKREEVAGLGTLADDAKHVRLERVILAFEFIADDDAARKHDAVEQQQRRAREDPLARVLDIRAQTECCPYLALPLVLFDVVLRAEELPAEKQRERRALAFVRRPLEQLFLAERARPFHFAEGEVVQT